VGDGDPDGKERDAVVVSEPESVLLLENVTVRVRTSVTVSVTEYVSVGTEVSDSVGFETVVSESVGSMVRVNDRIKVTLREAVSDSERARDSVAVSVTVSMNDGVKIDVRLRFVGDLDIVSENDSDNVSVVDHDWLKVTLSETESVPLSMHIVSGVWTHENTLIHGCRAGRKNGTDIANVADTREQPMPMN
jgi:hypothetical protein